MKSTDPELHQKLDELAERLDAGWDDLDELAPVSTTEAIQLSQSSEHPPPSGSSLLPHSAPPAAALAVIDADWDAAEPARNKKLKQRRPASVSTPPAARTVPAVSVGKRDRRDAERSRRAHEAQQRSANKKARKAGRRADARQASEHAREVELRLQAERTARAIAEKEKRDRRAASQARGPSPKQARRTQARATEALSATQPKSKVAPRAGGESTWKKLVIPIFIALLVGGTLGFALLRAR